MTIDPRRKFALEPANLGQVVRDCLPALRAALREEIAIEHHRAGRLDVAAVVVLAGPADSARMVRALRSRRADLLIYGGPTMGRQSFLEAAGAAAEGVRFPLLVEDSTTDYAALDAYDATRILVAAIRKAGLNRARIRDAVEELAPWSGVSGVIRWDALGRNSRPVHLGTVRDGRARELDAD